MTITKPPLHDRLLGIKGVINHTWWMWFTNIWTNIVSLNNSITSLNNNIGYTVNITVSDSPYTPTDGVDNVVCDTDGGAIIVNFPVGTLSRKMRVSNVGTNSNNVTLNGNGLETIHGGTSQTLYDDETLNTIFSSEGWW